MIHRLWKNVDCNKKVLCWGYRILGPWLTKTLLRCIFLHFDDCKTGRMCSVLLRRGERIRGHRLAKSVLECILLDLLHFNDCKKERNICVMLCRGEGMRGSRLCPAEIFVALLHFYYCKTGRICNVVLPRGERIGEPRLAKTLLRCQRAGETEPNKEAGGANLLQNCPLFYTLCQLLLSYIINHQLLGKIHFFGTSCQHLPTVEVQLLPRVVGSSKCSSLSHHTPQWWLT